ncbi:uncharacterized protein METZ01_LOCUS316396, partial [marine metagenome]
DSDPNLDVTLILTFTDEAENPIEFPLDQFTIDLAGPRIADPPNGFESDDIVNFFYNGADAAVDLKINLSEEISDGSFIPADLIGNTANATVDDITEVPDYPPPFDQYKLSLTILAQGVTTVTIPTGIFNDLAGNPGPPAAQAYSFTYDITDPVLNPITVSGDIPGNVPTLTPYTENEHYNGNGAGDAVDVVVYFDWDDVNFDGSSFANDDITIELAGDPVSGWDLTGPDGDNDYSLTIPSASFFQDGLPLDGILVVTVNANIASDLATNDGHNDPRSFQYYFDISPPDITENNISAPEITNLERITNNETIEILFDWDDNLLDNTFNDNDIYLASTIPGVDITTSIARDPEGDNSQYTMEIGNF